MTLLEIMIVLAIIAAVMGLLVGPSVMNAVRRSNRDIASLTVRKYANEAYPQWITANGRGCPGAISDLNEYMNSPDSKDPWGNEYQLLCGDHVPAGAKGIGVMSTGPDGKADTADDVTSWAPLE